jgi:ABC-2 type transport system permease protein
MTIALERRVPALGGFNATVIGLEIRRMLRNRRTLVLSMVMPTLFFLAFGSVGGDGASLLVSMAVYGGVLATTSGGAMVSIERAAGWSRQLRTTPLAPAAYIAVKMATSLVLSAAAVGVVYLVAAVTDRATMPLWTWILTAVAAWLGSLLFTAFGLLVGYLMPSENVMQVIGFVLMLFSLAGGLFLPLTLFTPALRTAATYTPIWGLNGLVHYPLVGGSFDWLWIANLAAWLVVFTAGAAWRFSKDTARV